MESYLFNIKGSIAKYGDIATARTWLVKARLELEEKDFKELVWIIFYWLCETLTKQSLADNVLDLLAEFDVVGHQMRREGFVRFQQERMATQQREAEAKKQKTILEEQERVAREARETIRLQRAAEARKTRERQERLEREKREQIRLLQEAEAKRERERQ